MMVRDYKQFNTYEEAELACIDKLIEIRKKIKEDDDLISGELVGY
jgi:viroplasmin and RNaseH domain-containing protein